MILKILNTRLRLPLLASPFARPLKAGVTLLAAMVLVGCAQDERRISLAEYQDKVYASWLGQCIGNMYGLAHEFKYNEEPRTEPITGWAEQTLKDIREHHGAYSDDDTDIEYVYLFLMEKYGPEPTYEQVAEFWKRHINNYIWVANRTARDLMELGYLPPLTGRKEFNHHWYQIDPQLVCEIWAVTAPGMLDYAAAKADWAAKVTNDDYGTHPTIWYNTMYAAAFFEKDVEKLCQIGYDHLRPDSIFRMAIDDVRQWKAEHGDDWIAVRKLIKEKYHDRKGLPEGIATGRVSALLNGALGVLALLYGEGDFEKTMNMACMAGYDADNQSATLAGLIAIIHGSASIPRKYTHVLESWTEPLNDFYKNRTRDELPDGTLTDIARRTAALGKQLVLDRGGRIEGSGERQVLVINTRARFNAPVEVRLSPLYIYEGTPATLHVEVIGGDPLTPVDLILAGAMPPGLSTERQRGRSVIAGTPTQLGKYTLTATVAAGNMRKDTELSATVRPPNQALSASKIVAAVPGASGKNTLDFKVIRDGEWTTGHHDNFRGNKPGPLEADFYGYEWDQPVKIDRLIYMAGPVFPNGGWFETLNVEYQDDAGQWVPVSNLDVTPAYTEQAAHKGMVHFTLAFDPVTSKGIRIIGKPGGTAQFTSISELSVPKGR